MLKCVGKLLVVASLAMAAACGVLWPRSYHRADSIWCFAGRAGTALAGTSEGELHVAIGNLDFGPDRSGTVSFMSVDPSNTEWGANWLLSEMGYEREWWVFRTGASRRGVFGVAGAWYAVVVMPLWVCLALSVPAPAVWAARRVRSRRRRHRGLCPDCGYDLRACPDRCAECGRVVDAPRGVASTLSNAPTALPAPRA